MSDTQSNLSYELLQKIKNTRAARRPSLSNGWIPNDRHVGHVQRFLEDGKVLGVIIQETIPAVDDLPSKEGWRSYATDAKDLSGIPVPLSDSACALLQDAQKQVEEHITKTKENTNV